MIYKYLNSNKWLRIKPIVLTEKYHECELDKNLKPFTEKTRKWIEIIIYDRHPLTGERYI